jgi:hypothetical protein
MRRHLMPLSSPIPGRHTELLREQLAPDDMRVNPLINLIIIGLGILIAGAMVAAALPHKLF